MAELSGRKIIKFLIWSAIIILSIYFLYYIFSILVIIAVSVLVAFIFEPFVKFLIRSGISRLLSTSIIFVITAFLLYLGLSFIVPKLVYQMNQLVNTLHVSTLHQQILSLEKSIYKVLPLFNYGDLSKKVEEFISTGVINSFDKISTLLSSIISLITLVVIVPFITFFLLKDSRLILHGILQMVPNKYFEMSYWILKKISIQLGRFVRGWIFDAAFVGIFCGTGYYVLGIKNALPLGLISGVGHLVPYFGPFIGGIPAIIISIIQYGNFSQVPFIILLIIIVYTVDNSVVQPVVFAKSVNMHPVVIVLLILIGSQLLGVIGMLLIIPFATVVRTATKEIYFAYKNYKIARQ